MSVLIVEDDTAIRRTLAINLEARGYEVATAEDGQEAVRAIAKSEHQLVILDLGLPRLDGLQVIATVRRTHEVPILVLSGRTQTQDKVAALDAGANDFVTKPFVIDELLARVRALLRTASTSHGNNATQQIGDATIDMLEHTVMNDGEIVRLTPTEWSMLEVLLRNPDRLVMKRELLTSVWGSAYANEDGYLRLYMRQLRIKLERDPARPRHLITEPGLGYRYKP